MKIYFFLLLLPIAAMAQWNNSGDNYTTGSVTASTLTTTANYGLNLAPQTGDAVIRRSNPGSLMISSNGGESEIRLNYNYGGGSGGMSIYDGGTTKYGNLKVNSAGHLIVSSSGGFVGIGTDNPLARLHVEGNIYVGTNQVQFLSASGGNDRIQSFGGSGTSGMWLFKSRFDNIVLDAGENAGNERAIILKTADAERLRADSYGNIGINKSNPATKLDLNGNFQVYPSGNAGLSGALKLKIVPGVASTIIEANSDYVWADHDIVINAANSGGGNINQLVLRKTGDVGVGTASPDARLAVKGDIHAQEVRVDLTGSTAPDYVFEKDYELMSLAELEKYVQARNHLPGIPSSDEMELNGINLKEMNLLLLKKVEELTLHLIEQSKRIDHLEGENKDLKKLLTRK